MIKVIENNYVPQAQGYIGTCPKCGSKIFFQDDDYRTPLNEVVGEHRSGKPFVQCPCCKNTTPLNEWANVKPADGSKIKALND